MPVIGAGEVTCLWVSILKELGGFCINCQMMILEVINIIDQYIA